MAGVVARCVTKTEAVGGIPSPLGLLRDLNFGRRIMMQKDEGGVGIVDSCSMSLFLNDPLGFIAILFYQTF